MGQIIGPLDWMSEKGEPYNYSGNKKTFGRLGAVHYIRV